jgi:phage gpG-like protein
MAVSFDNRFQAAAAEMASAESQLVRRTALEIEADIKTDMAAAKHGRTYGRTVRRDAQGRYVKRGTTAMHVASAAGEAPAVETGALANSITTEMDGALAAEVGTPMEYAPVLEGELNRPAFGRAGRKAGNIIQRRAERLR